MKTVFLAILMLLSLMLLQGCVIPNVNGDPSNLLYRFGDPVYISNGFYKGCKGHITGYSFHTKTLGEPPLTYYSVDAICYSVDGRYDTKKELEVFSGDLLEDGSPH